MGSNRGHFASRKSEITFVIHHEHFSGLFSNLIFSQVLKARILISGAFSVALTLAILDDTFTESSVDSHGRNFEFFNGFLLSRPCLVVEFHLNLDCFSRCHFLFCIPTAWFALDTCFIFSLVEFWKHFEYARLQKSKFFQDCYLLFFDHLWIPKVQLMYVFSSFCLRKGCGVRSFYLWDSSRSNEWKRRHSAMLWCKSRNFPEATLFTNGSWKNSIFCCYTSYITWPPKNQLKITAFESDWYCSALICKIIRRIARN